MAALRAQAQQPRPEVELQRALQMCECPEPAPGWHPASSKAVQAIFPPLSAGNSCVLPPLHRFLNFLLILHIYTRTGKCILFPVALLAEILPKPAASSFRGNGIGGKIQAIPSSVVWFFRTPCGLS